MNYRIAARKLVSLGCQEKLREGGGLHRKWFNPATNTATVIPDWGARDIKLGTLRAAIRQLGLNWKDFENA